MHYSTKPNCIYVVDKDENPLMPMFRFGKVRKMLKSGEAKIFKRDPFFTIQILKETTNHIQKINVGVDIGDTIGISAISGNKEILSSEVKLRSNGISDKIKSKSSLRRTRRGNLRYREKRFDNKKSSRGMDKDDQTEYLDRKLAPSIRHKLVSHLSVLDHLKSILPITNTDIIHETTKFDTQKMENPDISGVEYQQGDKYGYESAKAYVRIRDKHICKNPNCKHIDPENPEQPYYEKNVQTRTHHIIYRSKGGTDTVTNLITICVDCHTQENHQEGGFLYKWMVKKKKTGDYKGATQANLISAMIITYNKNNWDNRYPITYGSITNFKRKTLGLEKSHANDAFAIAFPEENIEKIINGNNKYFKVTKQVMKLPHTIPIIQTNALGKGRRVLESFIDAKYSMGGLEESIMSGKESEEHKGNRLHKTKAGSRRHSGRKTACGKYSETTKTIIPKHTIVEATINGIKINTVSAGITGNRMYTMNIPDTASIAIKKCSVKTICKRKGFIVNFDENSYKYYQPFKKK